MSFASASSCSLTTLSQAIPKQQIGTKTQRISFSGNVSYFNIPKMRIKNKSGGRSGGASGARMAESAAGSYASALADVANANGKLEITAADMEKIDKIFSEKEVFEFFINPTIPLETKRKVNSQTLSLDKTVGQLRQHSREGAEKKLK